LRSVLKVIETGRSALLLDLHPGIPRSILRISQERVPAVSCAHPSGVSCAILVAAAALFVAPISALGAEKLSTKELCKDAEEKVLASVPSLSHQKSYITNNHQGTCYVVITYDASTISGPLPTKGPTPPELIQHHETLAKAIVQEIVQTGHDPRAIHLDVRVGAEVMTPPRAKKTGFVASHLGEKQKTPDRTCFIGSGHYSSKNDEVAWKPYDASKKCR
jgi:hypothetical protein